MKREDVMRRIVKTCGKKTTRYFFIKGALPKHKTEALSKEASRRSKYLTRR